MSYFMFGAQLYDKRDMSTNHYDSTCQMDQNGSSFVLHNHAPSRSWAAQVHSLLTEHQVRLGNLSHRWGFFACSLHEIGGTWYRLLVLSGWLQNGKILETTSTHKFETGHVGIAHSIS